MVVSGARAVITAVVPAPATSATVISARDQFTEAPLMAAPEALRTVALICSDAPMAPRLTVLVERSSRAGAPPVLPPPPPPPAPATESAPPAHAVVHTRASIAKNIAADVRAKICADTCADMRAGTCTNARNERPGNADVCTRRAGMAFNGEKADMAKQEIQEAQKLRVRFLDDSLTLSARLVCDASWSVTPAAQSLRQGKIGAGTVPVFDNKQQTTTTNCLAADWADDTDERG